MALVSQYGYGQDSLIEPNYRNEMDLVKKMLADSSVLLKNDTITITLEYYSNGNPKIKTVYFHPEGAPNEWWMYESLNYAISDYDENGQIAAYVEWYETKHHGNYMQFDDDKFVTHWVFNNGKMVDVINENCRFLDPKGKIITKEDFFNQFESDDYGQWGYYLFDEYDPYSLLKCCDFVMYSDKYSIPSGGKEANKLINRLNKSCY